MTTLAISTSSGQFALAIGENSRVLFDSSIDSTQEKGLEEILSDGLSCCNREVSDISHIIVDVGPGGTSRVRTGVAFANALAYSLGISVSPVSSMELAGIDAWEKYHLPVLSTVKSIKGSAYIGLYQPPDTSIQYGEVQDLVPKMVQNIDKFVVVGVHRDNILQLPSLKDKTMIDSTLTFGHVSCLIKNSNTFANRACGFPVYAQPVTEKTL
ncbi:MAG: hypothetical protein LBC84_02260 [Prevotellaceae bacterium]|jgi:tRNA threonylcarbamoyladenosine biosynthesis protein TsaB|nr:hypothetical protein [Prevotellaceae bacterium]